MYVDARQLPTGTTLDADVCIVGAGPAGLALASSLIDHGLRVLVLESGSDHADDAVLALNHGAIFGDPYAGLSATRHRSIGGTTMIWNTRVRGEVGAKYVELDPVDFARSPSSTPGWPIQHEELAPYYVTASALCGLDIGDGESGVAVVPKPAAPLVPRLYHIGSRSRLLDPLLEKIRDSDSTLCHNATVLGIETKARGTEATQLNFSTLNGHMGTARANRFVLAGGAVENARILLLSARRAGVFGNEGDWVGRCFMEHPRDSSVTFRPGSSSFFREGRFFDVHEGPMGGPRLGRLGLQEEVIRAEGLPNASATLLPVVRRSVHRVRARLRPLIARSGLGTLLPAGGHGWSSHPMPDLVYAGFTVLLNIEQPPRPDNRIRLSDDRDALGMRRAALHWQLHPEDRTAIGKLRRTVADALRESGFLGVEIDDAAQVDPNAHHHAGTTRMSASPEDGVVDEHLRVHDMSNVFVAGASVLPTAGFANPLLTILALSLRLGDHLGADARP